QYRLASSGRVMPEQEPGQEPGAGAAVCSYVQLWLCRPDVRKGYTFPGESFYSTRGYASDPKAQSFGNIIRSATAKPQAFRTLWR
ncbi:MAG: hypothetical protein ACRD4L_06235, partial [Pyrinomonadaceae bacterium]